MRKIPEFPYFLRVIASCDQRADVLSARGYLVGFPPRGGFVPPLAIDFQPFRLTFRIHAEY